MQKGTTSPPIPGNEQDLHDASFDRMGSKAVGKTKGVALVVLVPSLAAHSRYRDRLDVREQDLVQPACLRALLQAEIQGGTMGGSAVAARGVTSRV